MPVYDVTLVAPNGNRVTRPIVAENADDAMTDMAISHDVAENDPTIQIIAKERTDKDGTLERLLKEAEARRLEAEFYRMPAPRRGRR